MTANDDILLTDDDAADAAAPVSPWKILVVDDEPDVHAMTGLLLSDVTFLDRPLSLLRADTAAAARTLLRRHSDIAVVLLDVVMEVEDAGLELVRWIRDELKNDAVRLILRTGQPGQAPQREVIVNYEINDYRAKAELSADGLFTVVITALRSFDHIRSVEARVAERTAELLESREQVRTILEASPVGVCAFDTDGRLTYCNRQLGTMLGLLPGQLLGTRFDTLLEERGGIDDPRSPLGLGRRPVRDLEVQMRRVDGSTFWALVSGDPLVFDGRLGYFVWVYDISRRKEAEYEIISAKEVAEATALAKSAFLSTMTHEIRTPLNGVLGMLELLERSHLDAFQSDTVATIRDSATALVAIINDVLDFSKAEAGRMELEQVPVSLATIVEGVSDAVAPSARAKGLELLTFVSPDVPRSLYADPTRLRQVLFNLAGNAVKFTDHGRVTIRADVDYQNDGWVKVAFSVTDTGIGIAPSDLPRLFKPFTQADDSISRRFGGTGLGLSICQRLVSLMHGEITVNSLPGRGSTFRVVMPLGVAPVDPVDMAGRPLKPDADLSGLRVLLAGTSPAEQDILGSYIAAAGAECVAARTHEQVAQRCRAALGEVTTVGGSDQTVIPGINVLVLSEEIYPQAVELAPDILGRRSGEADPPTLLIAPANSQYARSLTARHPDTMQVVYRPVRRGALLRAIANLAEKVAAPPAAARAGDAEPVGDAPASHGPPPEDRRILVVDDNAVNLKVMSLVLNRLGYATDQAKDGTQALALFAPGRYVAVLTDIQMPKMDGFALAEAIRISEGANAAAGSSKGPRLPILAVSANALDENRARYDEGHIDGWLTKPVQIDTLSQTLAKVIAHVPPDRPPEAPPANFMSMPPKIKAAPADAAPGTRKGDLSGPEATPAAAPAVQLSSLQSLCAGDAALVREMLFDFATASRGVIDAMNGAATRADWPMVRKAAHNLRGSSHTAGALALAEAAQRLDRTLGRLLAPPSGVPEAVDPDVIQPLIADVRATFADVEQFLSSF